MQYPRWQVPLLGGSPSHWVLGIVNFSTKVLGIYDSIPELRSQEWAVPVSVLWIHKLVTNNTIQKLLQTTVDAVAELACQPRIEWNNGKWKMEGYSPPTLKCQYDSWLCGIFVMMAMSAHQQNIGFDNTGPWPSQDATTGFFICRACQDGPARHASAVTSFV